jgi:predicted RNase H-like nuclease (RuvC/YqgF family)
MSTIKEVQEQLHKCKENLRTVRKSNKEKDAEIKELKSMNTFLVDRVEQFVDKNSDLRYKIRTITVDEVLAMRKEQHATKTEQSLTEQLEKQSEVKLNGSGIPHT